MQPLLTSQKVNACQNVALNKMPQFGDSVEQNHTVEKGKR